MPTHLEQSLQRDAEHIRGCVQEMSLRAERALRECVRAFAEGDRQLAYGVILRDLYIDRQEKEIDRLCLEFLVRQQPVGALLRFAYATIKVNLEVERVGDYAEGIARQLLKLKAGAPEEAKRRIVEMADLSITMFHDAVQAFIGQDQGLASRTMAVEETVDQLRARLSADLLSLLQKQEITFDTHEVLATITRRFERVSDQARNICLETLYMCTGEQVKHPGAEAFRILFLADHNSCRGQMAEAIARSLDLPRFRFESAGFDLKPVDPGTVEFMRSKGLDISHAAPKGIHQVAALDHYHVLIALSKSVKRSLQQIPPKSLFLEWYIDDPSAVQGTPEEKRAAYEEAFQFITNQVQELARAITGGEGRQGTGA